MWSTTDVVHWWLRATAAAAAALNAPAASAAAALGPPHAPAPAPAGPVTVSVALRRSEWAADAKLGLVFEPPLSDTDHEPPTLARVAPGTPIAAAFKLAAGAGSGSAGFAGLGPGARLVACSLRCVPDLALDAEPPAGTVPQLQTRGAVLAALKAGMAALARGGGSDAAPGEGDCELRLWLELPPGGQSKAAAPRVPRGFCSGSRLGVSKGGDLLAAFGDAARGLRKWTEACDGDAALGRVVRARGRCVDAGSWFLTRTRAVCAR